MRNDAVSAGKIGGIEIKIHATWVLVALLVVWSLADSYFPSSAPGYSTAAYWVAGIVVTLCFFLSLLLHELAHSLVARRRGLKVVGITLYLFGGVSEIGDEAQTPEDEIRITAVGPLTSLGLAAGFAVLWSIFGGMSDLAAASLGYLAVINLFLGIFNLIPGAPLDGGRLLQAIVWKRTGDREHASRVAAGAGIVVGYVLVTIGIVYVFNGSWVNGLWLVFLGWYLQSMAAQERNAYHVRSVFAGLRVADLVNRDTPGIDPGETLDRVVHDVIVPRQIRAAPVISGGRFAGLLTLERIANVPHDAWPRTTAASAMIPAGQVAFATLDQPLEEAVAEMQRRDVNQLPVLDGGAFAGFLSRDAVLRRLEIQRRLATSR